METALEVKTNSAESVLRESSNGSWLPRLQWIEFEDCAWLPTFIRDGITDALGLIMSVFKAYEPAFPLLREWAEGHDAFLDMASGSATHIRQFLHDSEKSGQAFPKALISDLYPSQARFSETESAFPGRAQAVSVPVDASQAPAEYKRLPRSIFSAFHHLNPDLARRVLNDAAQHAEGLFIYEPHPRSIRNLLANLPGLIFGMLSPFLTGKFSWKRLLFCTLIPVIPLMLVHDGIVSVLRCYTADEFRAMIMALPDNDFEWRIVEVPGKGALRFMKGLCVIGQKKKCVENGVLDNSPVNA